MQLVSVSWVVKVQGQEEQVGKRELEKAGVRERARGMGCKGEKEGGRRGGREATQKGKTRRSVDSESAVAHLCVFRGKLSPVK